MIKEEQVLFPMIQYGGSRMIAHPIAEMRSEHEDEAQHLQTIEHVTRGLALPEGACRSWTALYTGLRKFADDLVVHMHLENDVLFPRFQSVPLKSGEIAGRFGLSRDDFRQRIRQGLVTSTVERGEAGISQRPG